MRFERDVVRLIGGVRHGRTLGSPVAVEILNSEWPKWEQEMSAAPGTPTKKLTDAASRPRRPRRHAEVRLRRRARRARTRQRARDGGAGRRRARSPRRCSPRSASTIVSHVVRIGTATTPDGRASAARVTSSASTTARCAASMPTSAAAMIAEIKAAAKDGRLARWRRRGDRLRRAGRAGQLRALGSQARRTLGRGADEHPGRQGGRDR